jgi:hypothetical protein
MMIKQSFKYSSVLLLALVVLCESIQLVVGAIWFLSPRPLTNPAAERVFPEALPLITLVPGTI